MILDKCEQRLFINMFTYKPLYKILNNQILYCFSFKFIISNLKIGTISINIKITKPPILKFLSSINSIKISKNKVVSKMFNN